MLPAGSSENICRTVTSLFVKRYRCSGYYVYIIIVVHYCRIALQAIRFLFLGNRQENRQRSMTGFLWQLISMQALQYTKQLETLIYFESSGHIHLPISFLVALAQAIDKRCLSSNLNHPIWEKERKEKIMKRLFAIALALVMVLTFVACGNNTESVDVASAQNIADLSGAKIAAQAGTFHADAMAQIENVQSSTYPEFADLLTALKSGAIDGYIAEEPTAIEVCLSDDSLAYLPLVNNDTGFVATDADVGIAVGLKTGSELCEQINAILAEIPAETRSELMNQMVQMSAGKEVTSLALTSEAPANPTGTLRVAMECAYAPFNWTDMGEASLGAVAISGEGKENMYANGYDVQIAQYVANKLGMTLEIYAIEWDGLLPALQSGAVDAIIAGMSPTAEREEQIDFTNVYYSSNLVVIYKK